MRIFGAGMAGLLAAVMLRRYQPVVYEKQSELPDNHGALLRFRSPAVSEATGIPFQSVTVRKAVHFANATHPLATLDMANRYSLKVTGSLSSRSILNTREAQRYIAPPTFLADLAAGAQVKLGREVDESWVGNDDPRPTISTIPMPVMMDMVGWDDRPDFQYRTIWSIRARIKRPRVNVFQTIYYPEHNIPFYRASITGDLLIIESMGEPKQPVNDTWDVLDDFGIAESETDDPVVQRQEYGKLLPLAPDDEAKRRAFIVALTEEYNVYSIGRFANWRQILLDDVVNDVRVVDRMIMDRDRYSRSLHWER